MWKDAVWLGVPQCELEKWKILNGDLTGRFAYFRCELELPEEETYELVTEITANSRYRLWVNDCPVLSGPCKGDLYRQYYETVDLSRYLVPGKNVFAVQVLYNDPYTAVSQTDERAAIFSVYAPGGGHRLAVEGKVTDTGGNAVADITTGEAEWKVYLDGSYYLKSSEITENLGAVIEETDLRNIPVHWKEKEFDSNNWSIPDELEPVREDGFRKSVGLVPRFRITERPIPLLYERLGSFDKVYTRSVLKKDQPGLESVMPEDAPVWSALPEGAEKEKIAIPAGEGLEILFDAETEKNGYLSFDFDGGCGRTVRITYFEKFVSKDELIHIDDLGQGEISGLTDTVILDGSSLKFEPFWYRTFRFVFIQVEPGKESVTVGSPFFRKTGYPLEVVSEVRSSEKWVEDVWDICVRTLENCMTETYMDCPYYEQMQFPMDTRLQAMFNYSVSTDVRLARKALEDYHCSMTPDGLIHGKYPSAYCQIISTFSLHYIYMLREYYIQTGDVETVRRYLPDVDSILGYYDRKITENGLAGRLGYWEFVDWRPAWDKTGGTPTALREGPSTIINLMYAYALECGAQLNQAAKREGMAGEYKERKKAVLTAVRQLCWDEKRQMYREGPRFKQYSRHAQAWAVLNDMGTAEEQKQMLKNAAEGEDVIPCSFATSYEWFRALEKTGMYEVTKADMEVWKALPLIGNTTCPECPEEPGKSRSECHAWSALPLYEMIRCMAGIRPAQPGWRSVEISPHMEYVNDLEGKAATPVGTVGFSYRKLGGGITQYDLSLPENIDGVFVTEEGKRYPLHGGKTYCFKERYNKYKKEDFT